VSRRRAATMPTNRPRRATALRRQGSTLRRVAQRPRSLSRWTTGSSASPTLGNQIGATAQIVRSDSPRPAERGAAGCLLRRGAVAAPTRPVRPEACSSTGCSPTPDGSSPPACSAGHRTASVPWSSARKPCSPPGIGSARTPDLRVRRRCGAEATRSRRPPPEGRSRRTASPFALDVRASALMLVRRSGARQPEVPLQALLSETRSGEARGAQRSRCSQAKPCRRPPGSLG
jgi:hypothetical protein